MFIKDSKVAQLPDWADWLIWQEMAAWADCSHFQHTFCHCASIVLDFSLTTKTKAFQTSYMKIFLVCFMTLAEMSSETN